MNEAIAFYSKHAQKFVDHYLVDVDFRERYGLLALLLDRYADGAGTACDMGCGPGLFSFYLARRGVATTGIDGSAKMIEICEEKKKAEGVENVRFFQAVLPCPDMRLAPVDILLCSSLLEYIDDLDAMLDWFAGLLNPNGTLILSMPNAEGLYRHYERLKHRLARPSGYYSLVRHVLTLKQTIRLLERHGFVCRESLYHGRAPRLSRLASVVLPPRYSDNLFVGVFGKG